MEVLTFECQSQSQDKVALLSITLHVKTYKGIEKKSFPLSHGETYKCTRTTTDKTRHLLILIKSKHTDSRTAA